MYLHLGKGTVVNANTIIGIFDLDITSQSHLTRKYLNQAEKSGYVINAAEDIPKSFVVCSEGEKKTGISQPDGHSHSAAPLGIRHTVSVG